MATEEEPQAENQPADDDDQVTIGPTPGDDHQEEIELQEDTSLRNRRPRKDSDDSAKALEDVQLWEAPDEPLPEVLPSEVMGLLLLRRAGLTSQQRLSVQAAAGNSLKLESVRNGGRTPSA